MQKISALVDGELEHEEARMLFDALRQEEARHSWETYHLIGDALRGSRGWSPDFTRRFQQRLAQEPTVLAPRQPARQRVKVAALSAAASLAAVAVVGWLVFSDNPLRPQSAEIAAKPSAANVQLAQAKENAAAAPDNPLLTEYLMAHQEFSPSTRMQGVAPYIRMVSSTQDAAR